MTPITYLIGDATQPHGTGPKIIAHCCNDAGAWGAGFVLAISGRWPQPEKEYREWKKRQRGPLPLGDVQFVDVGGQITVANIIGQKSTGYMNGQPPIRYLSLCTGLSSVGDRALQAGASVHMPRIGCGLAGGNWDIVQRIIMDTLSHRGVPVFVYDLKEAA